MPFLQLDIFSEEIQNDFSETVQPATVQPLVQNLNSVLDEEVEEVIMDEEQEDEYEDDEDGVKKERDNFDIESQPYKFSDTIEFIYDNQLTVGVINGLSWNAGTTINLPSDNLMVKVEGKRKLIIVPVRNVTKIISPSNNE